MKLGKSVYFYLLHCFYVRFKETVEHEESVQPWNKHKRDIHTVVVIFERNKDLLDDNRYSSTLNRLNSFSGVQLNMLRAYKDLLFTEKHQTLKTLSNRVQIMLRMYVSNY